jgi:hypothetical protein
MKSPINSFNQKGYRIRQVYINTKSDEPLKKCITINDSLNSLDLSNSAKKRAWDILCDTPFGCAAPAPGKKHGTQIQKETST